MIKIISCGRVKEEYFCKAFSEYEKRISGYTKNITSIILPCEKLPLNPNEKEIKDALEKEAILIKKETEKCFTAALSPEGKTYTSEDFAEKVISRLPSNSAFIIGSSYGMSAEIKRAADLKISFSPMTFQHGLAKLILLEQIYRAFNILNNGKYHK